LRNAKHADDPRPIEENCACYACQHFSRAYLRHLIAAKEILGLRLTTIHNLHFTLDLMRQMRASILDGTFGALREEFLASWQGGG
jgi:queuine tRNA-ribosyltransferase